MNRINALFKSISRLFIIGLLPLITACTDLSLAVVNGPTYLDDITVVEDVVFDPRHGLTLDLHQPQDDSSHPVIIFFYGGSWQEGDKADYRFVATALATRGYLVAVPNYRQFPAVTYPAFIEDGAAATAWVIEHAARFGGDPDRVFLMGHSAGAQIAATLAIDNQWLAAKGVSPDDITAVAGLAGPYDFTPRAADIRAVFADAPETATHLSRRVDGDEPPMLMLYGRADQVVGPQNHERLAAALNDRARCYRVIQYDGLGHVDIVSAFSWVYRDRRPVLDDVLEFFATGRDKENCVP